MGRTLLAGVIGGIVLFAWGFVSHMVLDWGQAGVKNLPNEETLLPAMKAAVNEPGFYFFPGMDETKPNAMEEWEPKMQAGPRGVLVINPIPTDAKAMSIPQMGREFGSNVVGALIAAMIVSGMGAGFLKRTLAVTGMGLLCWVSINVSFWNWYWFPDDFTVAQLSEIPGWFLAGMFIAPIAGKCCCKCAAPPPVAG